MKKDEKCGNKSISSGPPGRTIYLARHGMIQKPVPEKIYIGQTDLPLSMKGHEQAVDIAAQLRHIPLTAIYTSDLARCVDTACYTARIHGLSPIKVPALREINLGQWECQKFELIKNNYPDAFCERGRNIVHFRPPGGESFLDLSRRVMPALYNILYSSRGDILIVGHAGVNRIILSYVTGTDLKELFSISQHYGSLNQIRFQNQRFSLIL